MATKSGSGKKSTRKYPNSKFNNSAIEKAEKNSLNVNVKMDKNGGDSFSDSITEEMRQRKELVDDIVIIITFLVSLLLFLSLFNLGGIIGAFFKNLMMGLFGKVIAFIFPFALAFFVVFTRSNKNNPIATRKMIYFWCVIALTCGLIHLFGHYADDFSLGASYKAQQGGGMIGELISEPLYKLFDNIASILILLTLIIVCLLLITGKAILHIIRKRNSERRAQMRAIAEEEREEEERRKAAEAKRQPTYNEFRQMSLDDIQEENRKKKLVMVDVENPSQNYSENEAYTFPKRKKKVSFIDRLIGYGKEQPENVGVSNGSVFQPIVNSTTQNPVNPNPNAKPSVYQDEIDKKFNQNTSANNNEVLLSNYSYDENRGGIPEIHNSSDNSVLYEEPPIPEYIPPEENSNAGVIANNDNNGYVSENSATITFDANGNEEVSLYSEPVTAAQNPTVHKTQKEKIELSDTEIGEIDEVVEKPYVFPKIELLRKPDRNQVTMSSEELKQTAAKLKNTLHSFGVNVTVTNFTSGPNVTRYELQPEVGTKVSRITALTDDIKLNLAAEDIRIEAPIPGKSAVGIEVPNTKGSTVFIRSLLESENFKQSKGKISFAVGKDIAGDTVVTDIAKMPHVLIAGATGSGKSVCINTIIISILYRYTPKDVRLIMIDPKVVELSVYNGIPHLLIPVVTDPKKAYGALNWAVQEMMNRYKWFAELEVRDIENYNEKIRSSRTPLLDNEGNVRAELPQILIIVDEMADLMMVSPNEVEDAICRLAQLARAAGIHLVLATQRPTVNVITGLIKANVPSRIAFSVASATDSRTILDQIGAEKLLGKGDMLFFPSGIPKPIRVQGAFVSDEEVKAVVDEIKKKNCDTTYNSNISAQIEKASQETGKKSLSSLADNSSNDSDHDEYFAEAGRFIIEKDKASIGLLQRMYKIGFNRAARIMDQLAEAGVVGPEEGTKPRAILMNKEQFENYLEQNGG